MLHHAEAILKHDMPTAVDEIETVLSEANIPASEMVRGGGGEGLFTQRLRRRLSEDFDWTKHNFVVTKTVDGVERESISHEIDHVKTFPTGTVAMEIEWNNKDPFYDRDLENFKRLHADGVISLGVIITRGASLQHSLKEIIEEFAVENGLSSIKAISEFYTPTSRQKRLIELGAVACGSFEKGWASRFVADKFGEATTHWRKLEDRVSRGVGNPCPLLLIGIPISVVSV